MTRMRHRPLALFVAIASAAAVSAQSPRTHRLEATPTTVAYGHYWSETKPVLTIASGDIIDVDTLLTSTPDRLEKAGVPAGRGAGVAARHRRHREGPRARRPHPDRAGLRRRRRAGRCARGEGPVDRSARSPTATTAAAGSSARTARQDAARTIIQMDRKTMTADVRAGHRHSAAAVLRQHGRRAAAGAGRVSSNPPGIHAGNLDNKELVAGTTLCIPVHVPGALFEIGDGHAAQGDGEVDQTGDRDVAARQGCS